MFPTIQKIKCKLTVLALTWHEQIRTNNNNYYWYTFQICLSLLNLFFKRFYQNRPFWFEMSLKEANFGQKQKGPKMHFAIYSLVS